MQKQEESKSGVEYLSEESESDELEARDAAEH